MTWTKEWPREPGRYWYFGKRVSSLPKRLYSAIVFDSGLVTVEGIRLVRSETNDEGWFKRVDEEEVLKDLERNLNG